MLISESRGLAIIEIPQKEVKLVCSALSVILATESPEDREHRTPEATKALKALIEQLNSKPEYICYTYFNADDVFDRARDDGKTSKMTMAKARRVLVAMEDNNDCNTGLTWETVSDEILNVL